MKKTLSILVAMYIMCCIGCNRSETKAPAVDYIIYVGGSDLSAWQEEEAAAGVDQTNSESSVPRKALPESCDFDFMITGDTVNENVPKTKDFSIAGKNYKLEYKFSQTTSLAGSKDSSLQKYGSYDRYATSGYVVDFMQETGQLLSYFDSSAANKAGGNFTEAEAKTASAQLLIDLFGDECLEYYGDSVSISSYDNTVVIQYIKYIGGYPTNDTIALRYNLQGELWSVNANTYGLLKSVTDRYAAAQLQAAESALTDYFDTMSYTYEDATLRINSDGKCYLEMYGANSSGMRAFYINVD